MDLSKEELQMLEKFRVEEAAKLKVRAELAEKAKQEAVVNLSKEINTFVDETEKYNNAVKDFYTRLSAPEFENNYTLTETVNKKTFEARAISLDGSYGTVESKDLIYKVFHLKYEPLNTITIVVEEHKTYGRGYFGKVINHGYKLRVIGLGYKAEERRFKDVKKFNSLIEGTIETREAAKRAILEEETKVSKAIYKLKEAFPTAEVTKTTEYDPYYKVHDVVIRVVFDNGIIAYIDLTEEGEGKVTKVYKGVDIPDEAFLLNLSTQRVKYE